jgi:tetratricopeptide (TPR) repeat protein
VLGHYRILEQIGAGGMGIVYRAHDLQLDRDVAIKILPSGKLTDSSSRSRFRKEALALARLNHPNIATVHEYGTEGGIDFLVTEYIPGITLDTKLASGPLEPEEALNLGIQIAQGLEAAHEQGIIHRDLKPGNLRINSNFQLKILDFGLAKFSAPTNATALTDSYSGEKGSYGTLPYMAPEQLRGMQVDQRSDIWAAGAVLYEMVTGQRPFAQKHVPQLIDDILHQAPKLPTIINPVVPPGLESIILKALDKDADRRYQSARELRVDLNRLQTSPLAMTSEFATGTTSRARFRNRKTIFIGALCLAVALLVVATVMRTARRERLQAPRTLAVLPFQAVGSDADTTALGTGMTETLTAQLAQASDRNHLQLVSTREIEAQGVRSAAEARRAFGADLVVEGSLQHVGSQLRINCSLVDAATQRQIAARSLTAAMGDIFGLEDRVATEALNLLSTQIPAVKSAAIEIHADTNADAYQHYLRGLGYLQDYDKAENIQSAITEFDLALRNDSHYARAYAGLGNAYWLGYAASTGTNDWIKQAAENCHKALQVADVAEGHICLGHVYVSQGEYAKGVDEFKRAVLLDSNGDDALRGLADAFEKMGNASAAEATYQKAIALRPKYWAGYSWMGAFYFREARYEDAARMFRTVIELTPESFNGYSNLGAALSIQGQYKGAIAALQRSIEIRPTLEAYSNLGTVYFASRKFADAARIYKEALTLDNDDFMTWGNLGDALYWTADHRSEADPAYRKAISLGDAKLHVNPRDATLLAFVATYRGMIGDRQGALTDLKRALEVAPNDADVRFRAALLYNRLGDTERTLSSLEKAVSLGYPAAAIHDTPDFDMLRSHPRFQALLAKADQKH